MQNNKGEGIRQQIEDSCKNNEFIPMEDSVTKEQFNNFLDLLVGELPDDMEIFTTDKGWHKVKDYR